MPTQEADGLMFSLMLPRLLYDRIAESATSQRRSKAFIVRDAIEEYFAARSTTHDVGNTTTTDRVGGSTGDAA